jgi:hypothetical protein
MVASTTNNTRDTMYRVHQANTQRNNNHQPIAVTTTTTEDREDDKRGVNKQTNKQIATKKECCGKSGL